MSTTKSNQKPVLVSQSEKPKGDKVIDWGILLKETGPDEDAILSELLSAAENCEFADDLETISLQYQWFKSKDLKQLYNFLVFRQSKKSILESANEVPSRTSGPKPPKPPAGVVEIFERDITLQLNDTSLESADDDEVPSRTSGPKPPPPPDGA